MALQSASNPSTYVRSPTGNGAVDQQGCRTTQYVVNVVPPLADLAPATWSYPQQANPGGTVNVTLQIYNGGAANFTGSFSSKVYLSSDRQLSSSDVLLGSI